MIGAGSHAQRVIRAAQASGYNVVSCLDELPVLSHCCGIPVLPLHDWLQRRDPANYVVAIGDPFVRQGLDQLCSEAGWHPQTVVHPFSWISPDAQIGTGVVILAGSVIEARTEIGRGVIVDLGAIVDHEVTVGDYSHLRPGAVVTSGSAIGSYITVDRA